MAKLTKSANTTLRLDLGFSLFTPHSPYWVGPSLHFCIFLHSCFSTIPVTYQFASPWLSVSSMVKEIFLTTPTELATLAGLLKQQKWFGIRSPLFTPHTLCAFFPSVLGFAVWLNWPCYKTCACAAFVWILRKPKIACSLPRYWPC